jgi:hypothetical protein
MSAPRISNKEEYWKRKGKTSMLNKKGEKTYKNVMLWTHDDLDGIYSAGLLKNYLISKNFNIIGYGIVNYQEGWKFSNIDTSVINMCVDFASNHPNIDVYIDHHGESFGDENSDYAIKTATNSAFEGVNLQCGLPNDMLSLATVDMVDSARYEHYNVKFTDIIHFDFQTALKSENPKLTFAGMVNQYLKRADHNTLIEVIHNIKDVSIYAIYHSLKEFYSGNNLTKEGERKSFLEDGKYRLETMSKRTRGINQTKKVYKTQDEFVKANSFNNTINLKEKGYQLLGNLCFVPSNTWCNAIRIKSILEEDINKGLIENNIDYILLQYGNTLQMVSFGKETKHKPRYNIPQTELKEMFLKDDKVKLEDDLYVKYIEDFGEYMNYLLDNFKEKLNYQDPSTYVSKGEEDGGGLITKSGGHVGIGSISNLNGYVKEGAFKNMKYIDLCKNKIIKDISNIEWNNMKVSWTDTDNNYKAVKEPEKNFRVLMVDDIRRSGLEKTKKELCQK